MRERSVRLAHQILTAGVLISIQLGIVLASPIAVCILY